MMPMMNRKLKAMIILKYETQEDFANAMDEKSSVVSNVVRGRRRLSPHKELEWAMALGCSPREIFPKK
ncbi:MAG: helix-turn-helix transcriptional regulator [bacterium]|nr:MAG: helix-turn-helix transcriptional regulator [bacterium]